MMLHKKASQTRICFAAIARILLTAVVACNVLLPSLHVLAQRPVPSPQPTPLPAPIPIALPEPGVYGPSKSLPLSMGSPRSDWWPVSALPVTGEEALRILQRQAESGLLVPAAAVAQAFPSEAQITPSISLLARALDLDPRLIFAYVHDHIDYVPTFGAANGASGTMWAGRGNDCDQSSLFIALMRAAGYTANYVSGIATYPMSRLANWLGVSEDQVPQVVANGGMMGVVEPPGDTMRLLRVWASAEINGQTYWFDPAMKEY
ncbi:MAG: hypothetical protein FJ026_13215, partial [Chloroflexi bacterium]|nr:hypothetical protein [Chloroflexota bacterium]